MSLEKVAFNFFSRERKKERNKNKIIYDTNVKKKERNIRNRERRRNRLGFVSEW
jgi:hypothetical protein